MDYFKIIKDSFQIALKKKYLWIFGILAGGSVIGGWNFNFFNPAQYNMDSSDIKSQQWETVFGSNTALTDFWANYWGVVVAIVGLIILLAIGSLILSIISEGALLDSVRSIRLNKENDFRLGFSFGWHNFWRVFKVNLMILLLIFGSIIILALPIVLFSLTKIYVLAIIYGVLVFLACLLFWFYLGIISPYLLRMVVLSQKGAWRSFATSWPFFTKNFATIAIMYLLLIAIGIAIAVGMILVFLLIGGLLVALGFIIYLASLAACIIYAVIAGLAFLVLVVALSGAINTFRSSVFTLTYLEITQNA